MRGFYCSSDGNNKKFASSKIHFQILLMQQFRKLIKVNVKPTFYSSLLHVYVYERKHG